MHKFIIINNKLNYLFSIAKDSLKYHQKRLINELKIINTSLSYNNISYYNLLCLVNFQ